MRLFIASMGLAAFSLSAVIWQAIPLPVLAALMGPVPIPNAASSTMLAPVFTYVADPGLVTATTAVFSDTDTPSAASASLSLVVSAPVIQSPPPAAPASVSASATPVRAPAAQANIQTAPVTVSSTSDGSSAILLPETHVPANDSPSAVSPSGEPLFSRANNVLWADTFAELSETLPIASRYTVLNDSAMHLDNGAIRFDWKQSNGCQDDGRVVEHGFPDADEIYIQFRVRYSPGFTFDWKGSNGPCNGNAKKMFLIWARSGARFDVIAENHQLGIGPDDRPLLKQNVGAPVALETLADGEWHRFTIHVKQSTSADANDGVVEGWIDGEQKWAYSHVSTDAQGYYLFKTPATFNQGSPKDQTEWLDYVRVWQ